MTACEVCEQDAAGRYLCERHTIKLAKTLQELPVLYTEVAECLVPRNSGWGEIVSTRGAAGPRSPVDEDVLDTVNMVRAGEVVHLWRVDVQRVRWPRHGAPAAAGLAADCRWLGMEMEWLVEHYPAAGDLFREVGDLERSARSIVGDPVPRPQRLGTCIAVDDKGAVCGAAISRLPGQTRLTCKWCQCSYGPPDWALLAYYQPKASA
ncbi:hypothetical protein [Streptomyces sp. B21-083]|uniref:hypothetical protein n=1 Tax=Streptomyces sp. B21-083 TaxID=3039410 RepID=UPI002FEFAC6E